MRMHDDSDTRRTHAFTLIELSIVLVIIALIVGGVLVGRDLVTAAGTRATIGQLDKYSSAFNTFRAKYNCIPGDCPNAIALGLGTPGGPGDNGDGNSAIYAPIFMAANNWGGTMKEAFNAWYHLSHAKLIAEDVKGYDGFSSFSGDFHGYTPPSKLHENAFITAVTVDDLQANLVPENGLSDMTFGNAFILHGQDTTNPGFFYGITALEAWLIDTKIDDGLPGSGNVRINYPYSGPRITHNSLGQGCGFYNWTTLQTEYDVKGLWDSYENQVATNPANPNRIDCTIAIGKAF